MDSNLAAAEPSGMDGGLSHAIAAELPRLRRHARSLVYSRADAEDLVQDCLETALARQAALKDRSRLRTWLLSILNNRSVMRRRADSRSAAPLPIDDYADNLAAAAAAKDGDLARELARAMARLSAEQRQILLLIKVEGLRYEEAAEALGAPIGTVMSRLARARERLRAVLEGETELRVVGRA